MNNISEVDITPVEERRCPEICKVSDIMRRHRNGEGDIDTLLNQSWLEGYTKEDVRKTYNLFKDFFKTGK